MHGFWTWMHNNPGDVATWVGALGTFLAFLAVVIPLGIGQRVERRNKARAQAESVAGWFEQLPPRNMFGHPMEEANPLLVLRNTSLLPVYEVAVEYRSEQPVVPLKNGDAADDDLFKRVLWVELLPPGEWVVGGPLDPEEVTVGISFVDAAGRYWLRGKDFRLRQLDRPPLESHGIDPSHHPREAISGR